MKLAKKIGFTLSEALIVIILAGVIAIIFSAGIKAYNPTQKGFDIKAKKALQGIDQALTLIIAHHSSTFTLSYLEDKNGSFSIGDTNSVSRFAALFKEYTTIMDNNFADKHSDYFSSPLLDYKKTSLGANLGTLYSNFLLSEDGAIYAFRLYSSCEASEPNTQPPLSKERYTVNNICGSIFFDVNAYQGPNKLGSDQYIIPINSGGTEIKKSL